MLPPVVVAVAQIAVGVFVGTKASDGVNALGKTIKKVVEAKKEKSHN